MRRPQAVTGIVLFNCLQEALKCLGINEIDVTECKQVVGFGTDGESSDIASAGLEGLPEENLPWVYWMWCLAHRLELAVSDALKKTS